MLQSIASRRLFESLSMICCFSGAAVIAGDPEKENLRRLAKLPEVEFAFYTPFQGKDLTTILDPGRRAEVQRLRNELETHGTDPERWQRLSVVHGLLEEDEKAKESAERAADLYRKLLENRPADPALLAQLGSALERAGREEEAGVVLRKAIDAGPGEWRGWSGLARNLASQPRKILFEGIELGKGQGELVVAVDKLRGHQDAQERIARAKKVIEECKDALDRAVSLVPPGIAEPYRQRANFRITTLGFFRAVSRALEGDKEHVQTLYLQEMVDRAPDALPDFDEAARRQPADFAATAEAIGCAYAALATTGIKEWNLDQMPEKLGTSVREGMARLEKQSQSGDEVTAARALEILAFLRLLLKDLPAAEEKLRAALALDPARAPLWDLLLLIASTVPPDRKEGIVQLFRERLKKEDTARNRFVLAKLYDSMEKRDEAEKELEAGLKVEPGDYHVNLGLAVLVARRSKSADDLRRTSSLIGKAQEAYLKSPSHEKWREICLFIAIFDGLLGRPQDGKNAVKKLLDEHPGDEEAQQIVDELKKLEGAD